MKKYELTYDDEICGHAQATDGKIKRTGVYYGGRKMTITIKDKKIAVALKKRSLQTGEKIY